MILLCVIILSALSQFPLPFIFFQQVRCEEELPFHSWLLGLPTTSSIQVQGLPTIVIMRAQQWIKKAIPITFHFFPSDFNFFFIPPFLSFSYLWFCVGILFRTFTDYSLLLLFCDSAWSHSSTVPEIRWPTMPRATLTGTDLDLVVDVEVAWRCKYRPRFRCRLGFVQIHLLECTSFRFWQI